MVSHSCKKAVQRIPDFNIHDPESISRAMNRWDDDPHWPDNSQAVIVLLGAVALAFYQVADYSLHDKTDDIDAILLRSTAAPDVLMQLAEALDISFRAGDCGLAQ